MARWWIPASGAGVAMYYLMPDSPPFWLRIAWSLTAALALLAIGRLR